MNRFDRHGLRRFRARDGSRLAVAAILLALFEGPRSGAPASRWIPA